MIDDPLVDRLTNEVDRLRIAHALHLARTISGDAIMTPVRPPTPALDAFFAANNAPGASRFTVLGASSTILDNAYLLAKARVDAGQEVDPVVRAEMPLIEAYERELFAWESQHGGYGPGDSPNDKPIPQPASVAPVPAPAPAVPVAPLPPVAPIPVVPTPTEHHARMASLLHGLFHALESSAHLIGNPAIMALLPAKYQGVAAIVSAVAGEMDSPPDCPSEPG